jgi:hypothetical protein
MALPGIPPWTGGGTDGPIEQYKATVGRITAAHDAIIALQKSFTDEALDLAKTSVDRARAGAETVRTAATGHVQRLGSGRGAHVCSPWARMLRMRSSCNAPSCSARSGTTASMIVTGSNCSTSTDPLQRGSTVVAFDLADRDRRRGCRRGGRGGGGAGGDGSPADAGEAWATWGCAGSGIPSRSNMRPALA